MKKIIKTDKAPEAIGPYSQAVVAGDFVFIAGQIALSPETDEIRGDVSQQTTQVLENIKAIIEAAGVGFSSVVRTTIYLKKPEHFTPMNKVYAQYFRSEYPARVTVFISSLPKGALVEIDAIAQI
jgi:2-iminobutanoate/2-iminopropanoate deaminase